MTESHEIKQNHISPSAARRKNAKKHARDCFFHKDNSLKLIAAALIPFILYMVAQGMYSMLYYAFDSQMFGELIDGIFSVVDILLLLLMLPLFGGTLYVATGLARGEEREVRDVFYAYTSWRAHIRTWIALLIPLFALAMVATLVTTMTQAAIGLSEMALAFEEGEMYSYMIFVAGEVVGILVAVGGLLLCGYFTPFLWLVFAHPERKLSDAFSRSVSSAHGHLGAWLALHLSFLGWLLLSVATVGILLVLFTIPYYLLSVTIYLEQSCDSSLISD